MSKSCISGLSVVFWFVDQRQDTANQGNIQRNAVNMINEMGDGTELDGRFKRRANLIQKREEDEEFQDDIKFQLIQKSSGVPVCSLSFHKK